MSGDRDTTMPDAIVDSRDCPLIVVVDRHGCARILGNGTAPPEQIALWLEALAATARERVEQLQHGQPT